MFFWFLFFAVVAVFVIWKAPQLAHLASKAKSYISSQLQKADEEFNSEKKEEK